MLKNRNAKAELFVNRIYFVLIEEEDGDVFPHGIIACPAGMHEPEARCRIHNAYRKVVRRHPDSWNWEGVIQQLEAENFQHIIPAYWIETELPREMFSVKINDLDWVDVIRHDDKDLWDVFDTAGTILNKNCPIPFRPTEAEVKEFVQTGAIKGKIEKI